MRPGAKLQLTRLVIEGEKRDFYVTYAFQQDLASPDVGSVREEHYICAVGASAFCKVLLAINAVTLKFIGWFMVT